MENIQKKQSFVMYASFLDAAMGLTDEEFREFILAMQDYALDGIEHKSKSRMLNGLLTMAQANLKASGLRWEKNAKNGDYGILGGRPRKGETAAEYKARKEALRQSLNLTKTQDNPMGFQSKTLNVDVDVNADVKENENWNVKGNVNVNGNGNGNWNEKVKEDGNAEGNEERSICKNTNTSNQFNSIITNVESCSSKSRSGEIPHQGNNHQGKDYLNLPLDPKDDERFHNVVRMEDVEEREPSWANCDISDLPPLVDEGWTPPPVELQHNEVMLDNIQGQEKRSVAAPLISKERAKRFLSAETLYARFNKERILQGDDCLCDEAAAILDEDTYVVRRCFDAIFRKLNGKVEPAYNKIYELIINTSPRDESVYIQILKDLWKFYIFDKSYWDDKAGRGIDAFNPYNE